MIPTRYIALIVTPALGCLLAAIFSLDAAAATATSVEIQSGPLRMTRIEDTVTGFGSVVVSDEMTDDISFSHPGQITELKVRPGQQVMRGQHLMTMTADPATLEAYRKAVNTVNFAERELARMKTLLAQHLATNAQVAAAEKAVLDAKSDVEAQRKLGNDEPLRVASASFDGYVVKVMNAPGDRIQANSTIMQLARTDQGLRVVVGLKPEDAGRVESGMPAQVSPVSAPKTHWSGTVRQISGTLNPTSRLIEAWIDVAKAADKPVPGTSASVVIVVASRDGWVVPRSAVLHDNKGAYIYQVSGGKAHRVEVETGKETDQETEIAGPFDQGLRVVTSGNYELRDGMAVREAPPARQ